MSPETNASPLNVSLSYCSFCCSVTVVPSECETWSSTFTDTMPSVRTCVLTFDALGAELPAVSAGGCSTIVPVDEPAALATVYVISTGLVGTCRAVRYTRLWLTRPVLMPSDGSASTDVTDSTPPIGSTSLASGSTMAVLFEPSSATSLAATGLADLPAAGCTSRRARPVDGMEPWVTV